MNEDDKPTESKDHLPSLLHHIFNADSRKVGFGWWVFIVATYMLAKAHIITSEQWMECVMLSTALIGGGTLLDTFLAGKYKLTPPPPPAPKENPNAQPPAAQ